MSKEITVYTPGEPDIIPRLISLFNKKYPEIKVNIFRASTGGIVDKLIKEKDMNQR